MSKRDEREGLTPLQQAVLALEKARARIEALQSARVEPVAIIGMACRMPGGGDTPETFWQLLRDGRDATVEVPPDRWDIDSFYATDPEQPGKTIMRRGSFLQGPIDRFDARFFGMSPREARALDPQQRLVLEVSWEAVERAGLSPDHLVNSRTGVYVGLMNHDFMLRQALETPIEGHDAYLATGTGVSFLAGRLSHVLGLQGPSMVVDTACSSSLVTLHLACQALRAGECEMALAGGVNLMLSPSVPVMFSRMRAIAADGRCKTFDASADGYGRGEGCGMLVLKRLSDARRDRDRILALVLGSAVNHDGPSSGLTVPNSRAQQAVVRQALAFAGIDPLQVSYVEAHGTGTPLGDPLELRGLQAVFGAGRDPDRPLLVGAVKTNIGHLEAAAGVSSVIKTVLALEHREIPPHLHLSRPNPHIPWDDLPLRIPVNLTAWPDVGGRRIAGISSFGLSGVNAHVVVEEGPGDKTGRTDQADRTDGRHSRPLQLLPLSAKTPEALAELSGRFEAYLAGPAAADVGDVCATAAVGRAHFEHRLALVASSASDARAKLEALRRGEPQPGAVRGHALKGSEERVAFLFTGQGSQYAGMGGRLYATQPVFRRVVDRCAEILGPLLPRPLHEVIQARGEAAADLDETAYTQPALFALEMALFEMWASWGIRPSAVLGHSVGEYAAACAAGVFSLEDGLKLIAGRARLMQALPRDGDMVAILSEEKRVAEAVRAHARDVSIAAVNGPRQVVISGRRSGVQAVVEVLERAGARPIRLNVSHAFHSPLMDPMLDEFEALARTLTFSEPKISLVSNVTADVAGAEVATPGYWRRHVRAPVLFAAGVAALERRGFGVFVEIGPHPVLIGLGRACISGRPALWLPSLRKGTEEWASLLESLSALYVRGAAIDWRGFCSDPPYQKVVLPTYPFQRGRYWPEKAERTGSSRPVESPPPAASPGHSAPAPSASIQDWFFEVSWRPKLRPGPGPAWQARPDAARLAERLRPTAARIAVEERLGIYDELAGPLDALCRDYVLDALEKLGLRFRPGERFTAAQGMDSLGLADRFRRLFDRLLGMLSEDGILRRSGAGWEVVGAGSGRDVREAYRALQERFPAAALELGLLARCGERLAEVLRGDLGPLDLLFPGGDLTAAARFYQESPGFRAMNRLMGQAVSMALEGLPAGRGARLLEIGAGTGGSTAGLVAGLPADRVEYRFTDVSPMFLGPARERFAAYPFMRYAVLDIEKTPESQGVEAGTADVVIAANVLHATRDLRQSLEHVKQLLAPGGLLLVSEGTARQRWLDLVFGLTEGWWRFDDAPLRTGHPLLSAPDWVSLLRSVSFEQPAAVLPPSERPPESAFEALLIARRPGDRLPARPERPGSWLILVDRGGVGEGLAGRLRCAGETCTVVVGGGSGGDEGLAAGGDVAMDRPEAFARLVREAAARQPPLRGVVHLWGLDSADGPGIDSAPCAEAFARAGRSALQLVQALAETEFRELPRLWLVTRGVPLIESGMPPKSAAGPARLPDRSGLVAAPLWGLGKVVALEHPELRCTRIDVDPDSLDQAADALFGEVLADADVEDQVAFRRGARYVARLARGSRACAARGGEQRAAQLNGNATYLITGGLGGLGLKVAEWMAQRGARHLVLLGRRGPSEEAAAAVRRIEQSGVRVLVRSADVSERATLEKVLGEIRSSLPPLRGVVHSAGVLDDGVLRQQTWERFARVLAPKADGSWNLHALTEADPLDFFVLFSSVASLLGSPGQANHAAACAFQDALAAYRRALGLPGQSLNWGGWSEVGAAAQRQVLARLEARGIGVIRPEQGLQALEEALRLPHAQVGIVPIDWSRLLQAGSTPPFFSDFRGAAESGSGSSEADAGGLLGRLRGLSWEERRALLAAHVRAELARVLGLGQGEPIPADRGFFELGMDSLTSVELRNRLQATLGQPLPSTLAFNYPSIESLTGYLLERLPGVGSRAAPSAASLRSARPVPAESGAPPPDRIAIVGVAVRFPGGAADPESYWRLLREGADGVGEIPRDRWDVDAYYDSNREAAGKMYTRLGAFLESVDQFDPQFFGIAPREAVTLDPQQRLLLEVTWEAIERAGIAASDLRESRTGVFVGMGQNDYAHFNFRNLAKVDAYSGTGNSFSVAAGRLSYVLGLQGPSLAVDTACSSSLVAVHLACQSLRTGESDLALAGGVHLMLAPHSTVYLCRTGVLSPDGRCRTFDASANGFVRGEGCGMVVLKRLDCALADGDRIHGVILGSAVNHDGPSSALTVPNGRSQEKVIRQALAAAGVPPTDVQYVEAHGTGTSLGDPIEVNALAGVFGPGRSKDAPLLIGSMKTNLGHLEAAAGVAGLIKVVLALEHGEIPPHLHFRDPNPHIPWAELPIRVAGERTPWPGGQRIAGVSSFGLGGTNAHVVVEAAPADRTDQTDRTDQMDGTVERPLHVLALSARSARSLGEMADRMEHHLAAHPEDALGDVCFTANAGRSHFEHRLALVSDSAAQVREKLSGLAAGRSVPGLFRGQKPADAPPSIGFLFTGVDGVEGGALRSLAASQPMFRRALDRCDAALRELLRRPLLPGLFADAGVEAEADEAAWQALERFALEWSFAELWRSWGVFPSAVAGWDAGEVSAGCAAGVFGPEDGFRLIAAGAGVRAAETSGAGESPEAPARRIAFQTPQIPLLLPERGATAASAFSQAEFWMRADGGASAAGGVEAGLEAMRSRGIGFCLGIGRPVTCTPGAVVDGASIVLPALSGCAGDDAAVWRPLLESLAALYAAGVAVNWKGFDAGYTRRKLILPTYPFQRQRYWIETGAESPPARHRPAGCPLYEIEWRARPRAGASAPARALVSDRWLVLGDRAGVGERLVELLRARGSSAALAYAGAEFQREADGRFVVRADQPGDFDRLLREAGLATGEGWAGVVHLWSLDAPTPDALPLPELECAARLGSESALYLVQATLRARLPTLPAVWLATAGAVPATKDDEMAGLAQSPLWGLGKALSLEHPELRVGLVDLESATPEGAVPLAGEILSPDGEDQVAWRGGQRYAARMAEIEPARSTPASISLDPEGVYLVTGGLGRLGLRVARWLAGCGVRHLVLVGRRNLSPREAWASLPAGSVERTVADAVSALEKAGATVRWVAADVGDPVQVARLMEGIRGLNRPLRGVVHAAGVPGYRDFREITGDDLASVFRPKVAGAWLLWRESRLEKLDFFIGFSSVTSLWGAKAQAHYGAANQFLDALAHRLRRQGVRALSLNWGLVSGSAMVGEEYFDWYRRIGIEEINPEEVFEALPGLLDTGVAGAAAVRVQWGRFKEVYESLRRRPLLSELEAGPDEHRVATPTRQGGLKALLEAAPETERWDRLIEALQEEVAAVLGLGRESLPDPKRGFFEMGMDSLTSVELRKRLEGLLGIPLPSTVAFDYPTVWGLAGLVARSVLGWDVPASAPGAGVPVRAKGGDGRRAEESKVQKLSDSEVRATIEKRLEELESLLGEE